MNIALIGPTELFVDVWCQQDKHMQAFRFYWHCRGVDIRKNGWRYDLRGNRYPMNWSNEQIAQGYGS